MIAALVVPGVVLASPAATASRDLPATVAPGANFTVAMTAAAYGTMGQVVETLPAGFSYVSSSLPSGQVQVTGNVVKFVLLGETSFTYSVTASTTAGTYTFSGIIKDENLIAYTIGGDTAITVSGAPPATTASRNLPDAAVVPGAAFNVGITASGYGTMGQVLETLPAGFSYVSSSLDASQVQVTGNVVKFVLLGETSFTYSVTASTTVGTYTFSGIIKDEDLIAYTIGGDINITVSSIPLPPPVVELEFSGSLTKGERETLVGIPSGATELDITLEATADIDLNLYDGNIFVIGWKAIIKSKHSTTGSYQGDSFAYSGWYCGDEYIRADGPLSRAYDLKVYGYEAGNYTVTVSYVPAAPPNPPPTIDIDVVPATVALGNPVTVSVSATDPDGVAMVMFVVWPEEYPEGGDEGPVAMITTFTDEGSLTFVPGWAGTYTVEAFACDMLDSCTPKAMPESATFVVSE